MFPGKVLILYNKQAASECYSFCFWIALCLMRKVCTALLPHLFVWDRSNGVIRSTFFNKDRNGKEVGGAGRKGMAQRTAVAMRFDVLHWGEPGGEWDAVVGGAGGRGQQSFKIGWEWMVRGWGKLWDEFIKLLVSICHLPLLILPFW